MLIIAVFGGWGHPSMSGSEPLLRGGIGAQRPCQLIKSFQTFY